MLSFQCNTETESSDPAILSVHSPMKIRGTGTTSHVIHVGMKSGYLLHY